MTIFNHNRIIFSRSAYRAWPPPSKYKKNTFTYKQIAIETQLRLILLEQICQVLLIRIT